MKNTSFNTLNADKGLTKLQSIRWFLLNLVDNYWMPNLTFDKNMIVQKYRNSISEDDLKGLLDKNSPYRGLCGLFQLKFPWSEIKLELGKIKAFDIGCGDGNLGVQLQSYSNNSIAYYNGADVNRNDAWARLLENKILHSIKPTVPIFYHAYQKM